MKPATGSSEDYEHYIQVKRKFLACSGLVLNEQTVEILPSTGGMFLGEVWSSDFKSGPYLVHVLATGMYFLYEHAEVAIIQRVCTAFLQNSDLQERHIRAVTELALHEEDRNI